MFGQIEQQINITSEIGFPKINSTYASYDAPVTDGEKMNLKQSLVSIFYSNNPSNCIQFSFGYPVNTCLQLLINPYCSTKKLETKNVCKTNNVWFKMLSTLIESSLFNYQAILTRPSDNC